MDQHPHTQTGPTIPIDPGSTRAMARRFRYAAVAAVGGAVLLWRSGCLPSREALTQERAAQYSARLQESLYRFHRLSAARGVPSLDQFLNDVLWVDEPSAYCRREDVAYFPTPEASEYPPRSWLVVSVIRNGPEGSCWGVMTSSYAFVCPPRSVELQVLLWRNAIEFEADRRKSLPSNLARLAECTSNPYVREVSAWATCPVSEFIYARDPSGLEFVLVHPGKDGIPRTDDDVWLPEPLLARTPPGRDVRRAQEALRRWREEETATEEE